MLPPLRCLQEQHDWLRQSFQATPLAPLYSTRLLSKNRLRTPPLASAGHSNLQLPRTPRHTTPILFMPRHQRPTRQQLNKKKTGKRATVPTAEAHQDSPPKHRPSTTSTSCCPFWVPHPPCVSGCSCHTPHIFRQTDSSSPTSNLLQNHARYQMASLLLHSAAPHSHSANTLLLNASQGNHHAATEKGCQEIHAAAHTHNTAYTSVCSASSQ